MLDGILHAVACAVGLYRIDRLEYVGGAGERLTARLMPSARWTNRGKARRLGLHASRIGLTRPDDAHYNDLDPHHCRKLTKGGRHVRNPGV
jgi:hypothetical protein